MVHMDKTEPAVVVAKEEDTGPVLVFDRRRALGIDK